MIGITPAASTTSTPPITAVSARFEGPGAGYALRSAMMMRSEARALDGAFAPLDADGFGGADLLRAGLSFPVMDQVALTSITQGGLSGLFGGLIDKPITLESLASDLWSGAGWVAPGQGRLDPWSTQGGFNGPWWNTTPRLVDVLA